MANFSGHLVSALGSLSMLGLAFLLSCNRRAIRWRTVVFGVLMQWAVAFLLLLFPYGQVGLKKTAAAVQTVLDQSYAGSAVVFGALGSPRGGDSGLGTIFAFQVLPSIVFIASLFAILYYLGIMQFIVRAMAWVMVRLFAASGAESLVVAASMFMGQTEAPLTIRPFLERLTESELFMVMVAGMASVSGAILGAYVYIGGVEIEHLLTAVAMTAPISLVVAKIMVPETQTPETMGAMVSIPRKGDNRNVLEAAANGASDGIKLAINVGGMLIAFIAIVALINTLLSLLVMGGEAMTLQRILGWLFAPFALLMGIPWPEAQVVAGILGTRTVLNEIVAYQQLHELSSQLTLRSQAITTVAICGFANFSSIGIQIGGLGAIVPSRKADISRLGLRALVAATIANFSTACVAGVFL